MTLTEASPGPDALPYFGSREARTALYMVERVRRYNHLTESELLTLTKGDDDFKRRALDLAIHRQWLHRDQRESGLGWLALGPCCPAICTLPRPSN